MLEKAMQKKHETYNTTTTENHDQGKQNNLK